MTGSSDAAPDAAISSGERFMVALWIADAGEDHDDYRYTTEHWFSERPAIETVSALFREAKDHFDVLYPGVEATSFSVNVERLRARDHGAAGYEASQPRGR